MIKEQEQRELAYEAAEQCKAMSISSTMFREMVNHDNINPTEVSAACRALQARGELDHLITFVWTFRKT